MMAAGQKTPSDLQFPPPSFRCEGEGWSQVASLFIFLYLSTRYASTNHQEPSLCFFIFVEVLSADASGTLVGA